MNGSRSQVSGLGQATLSASLEVLSGLHIGAGKDAIKIGGIDSPVVKTPDGKPYVPGSSLKGKLRFLLEWAFGKILDDGRPWGTEEGELDPGDPVLRIFGTPASKESWKSGPTRLLMRDAMPDERWTNDTVDLTEEKTEISIDRIAGKARDGGLRRTERVPPGARFKFRAAFRMYDIGGDHGARDLECLGWLVQGLDLLEQDALGGSGSRGYGRVRFADLMLKFPGSREISLDNCFRGHAFSREAPPRDILDVLKDSSSVLMQAQE